MKTQEQQEQKYGFYIISTMEVEETGPNPEDLKKAKVVTHLSYEIVVPGKKTIIKGFYPKKDDDTKNSINTLKSLIAPVEGEYRNDAKRLELARKWDALYPDNPASYTKKAPFTDEEVLKVYNFVEAKQKNPETYHLQSSNCVHEIQEAYQSTGRQGRFTEIYTSEELDKQPGLTMSGIGRLWMEGPFPSSDKPYKVLSDLSLEDFSAKWKIPVNHLSVTENTDPAVKPNSLVLSNQPKYVYTINPNPLLVASAASEVTQIDEHLAQLAVTEDEGESKVKSIIAAALQAFKEKFEAIRDKFKNKVKDDVEKFDKEASEDKDEHAAKVKAIEEQKNQKITDIKQQLQASLDSQVDSVLERNKASLNSEVNSLFERKTGEAEAMVSASSIFFLSDFFLSELDTGSVTQAEMNAMINAIRERTQSEIDSGIDAIRDQKQSEFDSEKKEIQERVINELRSSVASINSGTSEKLKELQSSMEQKLQLKSSDKKKMEENAERKEKAQVEEYDRKIRDIQEGTGLIERLKEVVANSGDAEALINEELNVVLQGAASDFGVDAEIL